MSDLIKREDAIEALLLNHKDVIYIDKVECARRIKAIPSADRPQVSSYSSDYPKAPIYVADLVRCKECRWGKPYSDKQLECDALGLGGLKFPDDFCSYGERE